MVKGGDTTLHVVVHPRETGAYDTTFKSILLPRNWQSTPNGVVHHETGHAFVDEHLGTDTCDGSASYPCTDAVLEHWGVDEGIAMILQEAVGNGIVGPAPADSFDEVMDDHCDIDGYDPDGAVDCAHDIGRLLVETFDGLVSELKAEFADEDNPTAAAKKEAVALYTKVVAEFVDLGSFREHVTFEDLLVNLLRAAPGHAATILEEFRDIGVTLPLPTTTSRDEELPGHSLPGIPVPADPGWFNNPDLFQCSVLYGVEYKVTCVRCNNDRPGDRPRG